MLIIDMPMPSSCADCELQTWDPLDGHYICAKTQNNIDGCVYEEKMKNDCPLIFNIDEIEPLSISACNNDKVVLKVTGVRKEQNDETYRCRCFESKCAKYQRGYI